MATDNAEISKRTPFRRSSSIRERELVISLIRNKERKFACAAGEPDMVVLDRRLTRDRKRWPQAPSEIAGIATLIALLEREKGTFHGVRSRTRRGAGARLSAACINVLTLPFMVFKPAHLAWPVII